MLVVSLAILDGLVQEFDRVGRIVLAGIEPVEQICRACRRILGIEPLYRIQVEVAVQAVGGAEHLDHGAQGLLVVGVSLVAGSQQGQHIVAAGNAAVHEERLHVFLCLAELGVVLCLQGGADILGDSGVVCHYLLCIKFAACIQAGCGLHHFYIYQIERLVAGAFKDFLHLGIYHFRVVFVPLEVDDIDGLVVKGGNGILGVEFNPLVVNLHQGVDETLARLGVFIFIIGPAHEFLPVDKQVLAGGHGAECVCVAPRADSLGVVALLEVLFIV